jgi:5-methylcytosine-specific restriction endonuclease McrA
MTDGSTEESASSEVPANPSKSLKKKLKKLKKKVVTVSRRSHQLYKRGMQAASEEELASHVQADFHAGFGLDSLDFGSNIDDINDDEDEIDDDDECDEEDGQCVEPFIVSDPEEGEFNKPPTAAAAESSKAAINTIAMLDRHPALVLNADYQPLRMLPLSIWSWQDTVKAVLGGKAIVVDIYPDVYIRAVNINMPVPSVIALRDYAPTGKARPAFTRRNVFLRDGYRCQYCLGLFRTSDLSLDHVEPRCLGCRLTWENAATCCKRCNGRKGSLRPTELHRVGMELKSKPRCPTLFELAAEAQKFVPRRVHPTWAPYLGISSKSGIVSRTDEVEVGSGSSSSSNGGTRMKKMKKYRPYE